MPESDAASQGPPWILAGRSSRIQRPVGARAGRADNGGTFHGPQPMPSQSIADLLDRSDETGRLMPQAERVLRLRQVASEALPAPLRRFVTIANVKGGEVHLFAGSSAVAAKLRLLEPSLLAAFERAAMPVASVRIQVRVDSDPAPPVRAKRARLAAGPAAQLGKLAAALPDGDLRVAVARLSTRAKPSERD